ncbi:MAG: hypothetical protein CMG74_13185 [Candidatus Marinimicrobia bacterium]|nr:hypothetical protein [Candidatus Neomarinimicrobiota bacterium]|tara:strand:+ start:93 stop:863 length:771 start_codon:yes stop_codon:yes gene_type:complete
MDFNFKDKTAIVTGASSGVGKEVSLLLCKYGCRVLAIGRNRNKLDNVLSETEEYDGTLRSFECDLSVPIQIESLFNELNKSNEKPDILINNAAVFYRNNFEETTFDQYSEMIDVNLTSTFKLIKYVIPIMKSKKTGDILNITSVAGCISPHGQTVYGATKATLNHLTKGLAVELGPYGIRINALAPGPINSPLWEKMYPDEIDRNKIFNMLKGKIPLGRISEPKDIAYWCLKILDSDHNWMTGSIINLDGGRGLVG